MKNEQLAKRMYALNIGVRELASRVGVKPSMLYMILNTQKTPSIRLAFQIARELRSTVDELFGGAYGQQPTQRWRG
jgi:transcriptional regulator with XRE-family HTH domain